MGTLYVVATPIGNLEDITLRALRILREVSLIAAEDTRETRKLLSRHGIVTPATSYFEHSKLSKLEAILARLQTGDVALVSDAGTPGISDPGYELVRAAIDAGHPVVPVPGPSAVVAALAVSGLPTDQFVYFGFLPRRSSDRRRFLAAAAADRRTLVAYESPHRLLGALEDVRATLGNRRVAIATELTKLFEEVFRGTVSDAIEWVGVSRPRGEYTLVIAGANAEAPALDAEVEEEVRRLAGEGYPTREVVERVAGATGRSRREVYRLLLRVAASPEAPGEGAAGQDEVGHGKI